MSTVLFVALLLAVIVVVLVVQTRYNLLQYLFFLRVPLLGALVMVALPFFAGEDDPQVIQNWFELDFIGLAIATWLALTHAWLIMHVSGVLFTTLPMRVHLPFVKPIGVESSTSRDARNEPPDWFTTWKRYPVFAILALPIVYTCWQRSEVLTWTDKVAAVFMGVVLGALMVLGSVGLRKLKRQWDRRRREAVAASPPEPDESPGIGRTIHQYLDMSGTLAAIRTLRSAWAFLFFASALYVLGFGLSPGWSLRIADYVPAIAYMLILLMLIVSLLSGLSLILDRVRLPLLVVLIAVGWLNYTLTDVDHYYDISIDTHAPRADASIECADSSARNGVAGEQTISGKTPCEVFGAERAVSAWLESRPETTPIVIVAASGGGITAAYWSVAVLEEIHRRLGRKFAESIVLVSAVSGGAVGTMYYVDRYTETSPPVDSDISEALELAGRSSLSAIGWSTVYPDFWRLFIPLIVPKEKDRGWALERRWAARNSLEGRRLMDWQSGVEGGWRPTMIFNATVSEMGHRLLIAPINLDAVARNKDRKAQTLVSASDTIDVVTAARLSATFPYVSPFARSNRLDQTTTVHDYHISDGGYFDNFGVMSAIDFLFEAMPILERVERPIIMVEIRASDEERITKPREGTSLVDELTGPLDTLLNVRTPMQLARNKADVGRLTDALRQRRVPLYHFTFLLHGRNPLSWHLSESEKQQIRSARGSEHNRIQIAVLESLFAAATAESRGPPAAPPAPPPNTPVSSL